MGSSLISGLWQQTLWGGRGANLAGNPNVLDIENCLLDVLYRLGFQGANDIGPSSWVTPAELYQFADDAAKKIAYEAGVLITVDSSVTVTAGTATYSLPAAHVFTVAAALGSSLLRLTSVRDLWALDAAWQGTAGAAARASLDAGGVGTITLYPNPNAGGTLQQVCQMYAQTVTPGTSALPLATVLQDYFSYRMLEGARSKESEERMEEMGQHFQARAEMYEQIMEQYWGPGQ